MSMLESKFFLWAITFFMKKLLLFVSSCVWRIFEYFEHFKAKTKQNKSM